MISMLSPDELHFTVDMLPGMLCAWASTATHSAAVTATSALQRMTRSSVVAGGLHWHGFGSTVFAAFRLAQGRQHVRHHVAGIVVPLE